MRSNIAAAAGALLLLSGAVRAQVHATDVILSIQNGRILIGRVDNGITVTPKYVFLGTLGDTGIGQATFNPGYDSQNGTFSINQPVGITIRRALRRWNGADFSLIPPAPTAMDLIKNNTVIETPASDPPACAVGADLLLGLSNSVGRLHQHPAYELIGPGDAGIYMLELQVWMTDDATGVSDPIYVLFDQNDAADVDAAFAWAEANLRPAGPACYANCDGSTQPPALNVNDFVCFQMKYAQGDCYANCDESSIAPILNINDFVCFLSKFAAGCP